MKRAQLALLLLLGQTLGGRAQSQVKVTPESATQYPSLVPLNVLMVSLPLTWTAEHAESPATYQVVDLTTKQPIAFQGPRFPFVPDTRKPNHAVAYLILPAQAPKHSVKVVLTDENVKKLESAEVKLEKLSRFSFNLNPQAAPNEGLTNGKKRDVGQFGVTLDFPELTPGWGGARTYLHSENLFSTDELDSKSKFDLKAGLERSLVSNWLVPGHIESELQGDQVANNLSYLLGGGVKALLPWNFTATALNNDAIEIPLSPTFAFDVQYEHRIQQDAKSIAKFPNKNALRLHEESTWIPINLLPNLLNHAVSLELHGQAWLLPLDKTKPRGNMRLEGAGDASLLIALTPFAQLPGLNLLMSSDPAKTRIRVKYSGGADEATGFKHSHQWSFGLELVK